MEFCVRARPRRSFQHVRVIAAAYLLQLRTSAVLGDPPRCRIRVSRGQPALLNGFRATTLVRDVHVEMRNRNGPVFTRRDERPKRAPRGELGDRMDLGLLTTDVFGPRRSQRVAGHEVGGRHVPLTLLPMAAVPYPRAGLADVITGRGP